MKTKLSCEGFFKNCKLNMCGNEAFADFFPRLEIRLVKTKFSFSVRIFRPKLKVTLISAATFIQVATIPMTNHCSDAHRSDNHSRDAYRSDKRCNDNHRSDKCCHDFHRSDNHCNEFRSSVTWKYKLLDFDYSFWFLIMSGFLLPHSQWTSHLIRWLQFPFGYKIPVVGIHFHSLQSPGPHRPWCRLRPHAGRVAGRKMATKQHGGHGLKGCTVQGQTLLISHGRSGLI